MAGNPLDRERESFAALLRRYRAVANLTQEQLAGRAGLSVQAISMLERGVRRAPRSSTVELLAEALELRAPQRAMLVAAARQGTAAPARDLERASFRVFLCHTPELREHPEERSFVAAADAAVLRAGHAATDVVAEADVYVGIIGLGSGAPAPDRPELSHPELEFESATARRLPRLVFLVGEGGGTAPPAVPSSEPGARQEAFRRRLREAGVVLGSVASPAELETGLHQALVELEARPGPPALPPEPRAGIPPDPIANFVDREAELATLERQLERDRRVAVYGLGGIGKTQLVVRHLHRQRARYRDGVFWLRADHESSLVGDLASLAWRLELPERERPQQERQVEAVLRWLREHRQWLLVLDNLEPATADAVRRWLPPGLPGHVVVTSRAPTWSTRLRLEPLSVEIATRFLLGRTGQADGEAAVGVAETLGRLPLALEQAAAYLETSGRDLASYGDLLRTHLVELMAEGKPEDYPRPVASTWQLSFERMEEERPAAVALLRLCSFLGPDDVPVGLLVEGDDLPPDLGGVLADEVEFDRIIATLRRYSLMERQGDALRVHRLVQAVVRESLSEDQRQRWLAAGIRLLRCRFPADVEAPDRWPLCARLLPHAQVVARLAADQAVEPRALGWLLDRAGRYLWLGGEFAAARPLLERALRVRERSLGPDHLDTAESLHGLAGLLGNRGELEAARALVERALAVRERELGADHPDTAESLNRLAGLLWDQGQRDAGRSLMQRALAIRERVLGPDRAETADSLGNLATMLRDLGELSEARSLHERALAIRERVLGTEHVRTANSLNSLAMVLRDQGDLAGARVLVERALAIRERVLGPDHPIIAFSLDNLALVLRDQRDPAGARSANERALAIRERALGPEHPLTTQSRRALEEITADQERTGGTG
jgi:tetratricopeptide (TPR) repeat protein/transcriptional regulator with XRE-family HTH domain